MKPVFLLLAFLAAAAMLILRGLCAGQKKQLFYSRRINVWVIVKNQELFIEGFIRKLFLRVNDTTSLNVYIVDDCSCDRTPEILDILRGKYPFALLSGEDRRVSGCGPGAEFKPGVDLRFDARGLKGRELLNAPLFCHLTHLNEGKTHFLSK